MIKVEKYISNENFLLFLQIFLSKKLCKNSLIHFISNTFFIIIHQFFVLFYFFTRYFYCRAWAVDCVNWYQEVRRQRMITRNKQKKIHLEHLSPKKIVSTFCQQHFLFQHFYFHILEEKISAIMIESLKIFCENSEKICFLFVCFFRKFIVLEFYFTIKIRVFFFFYSYLLQTFAKCLALLLIFCKEIFFQIFINHCFLFFYILCLRALYLIVKASTYIKTFQL